MKKTPDTSAAAAALRQRAEAQARRQAVSSPTDLAALSPDEARQALHELQVHQIELEMQNEELRRSQAELDASRACYLDLYDQAPVGYCTLSEQGLILEANLTAAALLGVPRGALVKQPISHFIVRDDQDICYLHRKQLLETGEAQTCELRLVKPDGTNFWAHLTATTAPADDGAPRCRVVLSDITERKRTEKDLSEMAERYRLANKATNDVVWDWDIVTDAQRWNESGAAVFGWTEIVEAPQTSAWWVERVHPEDRSRVDLTFFAAVDDPATDRWRDEYRFRKADGTYALVVDRGHILRDADGRAIRMIGAMQDITERKRAEVAQRETFMRLQESVRAANVGLWDWDLATNRVHYSREWKRQIGYDETEIGDAFEEWESRVHPEDLAPTLERVRNAIAGDSQRYQAQFRFRHKDGSYRWIVAQCFVSRDKGGKAVRVVGSHVDLTEYKQVEEALRESEKLLSRAQEIAHTGSWKLDLTANRLTWSDEVCRIFGCKPQEFGATYGAFLDFVHPEDRAAVDEAYTRSQRDGNDGYEIAHRIVRRDSGEVRHVHERCVHERDASGAIIRSTGMVQDITDRKRAEEEAARSAALLRDVVDMVPAYICAKNSEGRFLLVNRRLADFYGIPIDTMTGMLHAELCEDEEELRAMLAADRQVMASGRAEVIPEETMEKPDGSVAVLETYKIPFAADGKPAVLIASADITERKRAEAALRASEEKYRLLVEHAQEAVFVVQDGVFRFVNPACSALTGRGAAELIGVPILELVPEETRERLRLHHQQVLRGERMPPTEEFAVVTAQGQVTRLLVNAVRIEWEGRPASLNFASDITERKQSEVAQAFLAQCSSAPTGENFFAALARFLAAHLGMDFICIDRLEGDGLMARTVAVWCDGKFEDNVTYALKDTPCGDVVGKTVCCFPASVCQFFPRDTVLQDLRAESYVGVTLWSHTGQPIGLIAVIGRRPLANRPLAEAMLKLVAVRAAGELERTLAEENLDRERRLLRTVIDNLPDGIYAKDCDARKTLANRANLATLGAASEADVLGKLDSDMLPPDVAAPMLADDLAVIRTGQPLLNAEEQVVDHAGKSRWLQTSKIPLRDSAGSVVGLVGIGHDITAIKEAEEEHGKLEVQLRQAQKMEAIGRLAGGVAHDFNNKLQTILGITELLANATAPNDPRAADLKDIMVAARGSADLTRQLLAFARRQTITPKVLDLNDTVTGMLRMLARLIGEDIDLVWRPAAELWPVKMDPSQLDQILANLAVNARDAIAGVGRVSIATRKETMDDAYCQAHPDAVPGDYVVLEFSDSGCGMDAETMAHMFEPFFTTKPLGQGTGLGLATVYGIVRQNNGFIDVRSAPGKGATFAIHVPRHAAPAAAEAAALEPVIATGTGTVLLVEDEVPLLRLTGRILEGLGYTVLAADGPREALRLATEYPGEIRLLLTDVVMPDMSGRDLRDRLSALRPAMKCVFMSGYTADAIAHRGFLEEGLNFIQKPFSRAELAARLREVLAGSVAGNHYHPTEAGS